ncbi:MAG: hypothetical protein N4A33_13465 [Bacteriovoracaceae bacterium]|nr:hypothetical protein [Bacteriovoracaceae bacterium]
MRLLLFLLVSLNAFALLEFEDATSPELIKSARALAMGGAYMSKVDDGWSAFYNPAGLGTVRKLQFHLTNIHIETNNGFLDATSGQGSFLDAISSYSDAFSAKGIRPLLADTPGTSLARVQLYPNITYRYFSIGYMYHQQQWARLENPTAQFEVAERVDSGPVAAFNISLLGGILKFGVSGVLLTRQEVQKDFAHGTAISLSKTNDYKKASMTYLTAGMRLTFPVYALPTFSVVYRNAGSQDWSDVELSGAPNEIPQTMDASFSLTPHLSRTFRMHFEAGARDLTNEYDTVKAARKLHAGFEIGFLRAMFFRAGYSDGWGSGGIGVRNRTTIFDLSTYAVEMGDGYRDKEDRRYAISISSGF